MRFKILFLRQMLLHMKKLLGLLLVIFVFSACDDGDIKVDTINFDAVTAAKCGNNDIVYKLNGGEMLLVEIPETATQHPYENISGVKTFEINASNRVRYRLYNGAASTSNICETLQPATPTLAEEWLATAGTIEITTTAVYNNPNATTGAVTISKFNHNIIFRNIIFSKPEGNQVYEAYNFGSYLTNATQFPFDFPTGSLGTCSGTKIYNVSNGRTESLVIENVDPSLIQDAVGVVTQPISSTVNKLVYRTYESAIPLPIADYFCATTTPAAPTITEEWVGVDGVPTLTGLIEVTTTTSGTGFSHTIRLKKITFQKGSSTFYFGDDILYGVYLN